MKKKTHKSEHCRKADKDRAPLHPSKTTYLCSEVPLLQQSLSFIPAGPGLAGNQNYALHPVLLPAALWQPQARQAADHPLPKCSVPRALPGGSPPPSPCFESHLRAPRNPQGLWRSHWHLPLQQTGFCAMRTHALLCQHGDLGRDLFYANKPLLAVTSQG